MSRCRGGAMDVWGRFVGRRAWAVLVSGIAVVVAAGAFGFGVFAHLSQGGFDDPASESARELAVEQDHFGGHSADVAVIYSSSTMRADDPAFRSAVEGTMAALPHGAVQTVVTYYDTRSPALLSTDGRATRVIL